MISLDNKTYCEKCFEIIDESNYATHCCHSQSNIERYPTSLAEGTVLSGKYLVGSVIGKGGFGITYLCYDLVKKCRIAIKEYFPDYCAYRAAGTKTVCVTGDKDGYKSGVEKFYKEAKLLSGFRNTPSVVEVLSFFQENNTAYLVMEYLDGCDLKTHFQKGARFDENYVIFLLLEILKGLKQLHDKKIYHRDISPDNIFLCNDGRIKLIDFGSARTSAATYSIMVKPGFAPMEQYQTTGNQGPWTDIYEVGATAYYFLKRVVLEAAPTRVSRDVIDLSGISPKLAVIISKMIAVRIEHRYTNVSDVINELVALLNSNAAEQKKAAEVQQAQQVPEVQYPYSENGANDNGKQEGYIPTPQNTGESFYDRMSNDPTTKALFIATCVLSSVLVVLGIAIATYFAFNGF